VDRYKILLGKTPPPAKPEKIVQAVKFKKSDGNGQGQLNTREQLLSSYLSTSEGRATLASSMAEPLRQRIEFSSLARRSLIINPLPDGALPIYNHTDPVYVIGEDRENILLMNPSENNHIIVPIFNIHSNSEIPISGIRSSRFNLIERAQDQMAVEIRGQEDRAILALLSAATESGRIETSQISGEVMREAFNAVEQSDFIVNHVFTNPRDYSDIRINLRDHIDPVNQRDLLRRGVMGQLWGATVIVSRVVPQNELFFFG